MVGRAVNSPELIGRDSVLTALFEAQAAAASGRGQVALITGTAGIGKTRLVQELISAAPSDVAVASGYCDELDRSVPFAPMASLLRSAGVTTPLTEHASQALDEAEVARAAARSLLSTAASKPLMAIVEDLHWSDEATATTLGLVARAARDVPIFVILTARPEETPTELVTFFATLDRLPHAHEWRLEPLSMDETGLLLAGVVGSVALPPRRFTERVHLITEGNPLFVEEVVGALGLAGTAAFPDPADVDRAPVPRSVQAAVWQRSRGLSDEARRLLQLAAVAGRQADVNVLARILGLDEPALIAMLRQALATNLVVEDSADHIAFRHELARRAILADLLARERRALHLVLGHALEAGGGASPAELATHFWEAEQWERARRYAAEAAHHASALGAPRAAIDLLTKAIQAVQRLGLPPDPDLLAARASAYDRVGQFELAGADLASRLEAARAGHDREAECATLLDLGSLWTARDYGAAGDYFRRALDAAYKVDRVVVLAAALNRVASWHLNSERPLQAQRLHREALGHYQAAGDEAGTAATFDLLATLDLTVGDFGGATRSYREAIERFRARHDAPALASALAMQAFASPQYLGWPASWSSANSAAEAEALAEESITVCRDLGWRSGEALGYVALASVLGEAGRYREALSHAQAASDLAAETEHAYWALLARLILGVVHLDLLDAGAARRHLQQAFDMATAVRSDYWRRIAGGFLVDACLLSGDRSAAWVVVDAVGAVGDRTGRAPTAPATVGLRHMWRGRAELALADGDDAEALAVVEWLDGMIRAAGSPSPRFLLLHGRALAAAGRRAEAEATWRAGIVDSERQGCIPASWRLHAALGRALRAQHRLDEADQHLHAARQHVATLAAANDHPDLEAAAARLLPAPTARRRAKEAFGGLTAREQEVARLVADGLTNADIAGRLVVSPRTVEKHVEHVLTKLGLATRAQVAAWAVRTHLVAGDDEEIRTTAARRS